MTSTSTSDVDFTEDAIQTLFGHEAAEDEEPARLREYYFKTSVYDQVNADVPLRILVGHKGIGKSALFKVGIAEAAEAGKLTVVLQPNDVAELEVDDSDFLRIIRNWTHGLTRIIATKALLSLGVRAPIDDLVSSHFGDPLSVIQGVVGAAKTFAPGMDELAVRFFEAPALTVYVDDLDRGWQARPVDVRRISALLNAVRDMANANRRLSFKIALRSDVYYAVRTSDESTDKIEGSVIWQSWNNHEIFVMLVKRIETFFGRSADENQLLQYRPRDLARFLEPIMEPRFHGKGHWSNIPTYRVLMSLTRKRPRDLVKLCTLAARHAHSRRATRIATEDFDSVFEEYSSGRVQDTINEYRSELPNIQALIMNMKPNRKERQAKMGYVYKTSDLILKIRNIMESNNFSFATKKGATDQQLAAFMYKINFLTARKETDDGLIARKYFEENRYLSSEFVDFGFDWEVHPAYRWALQPDNVDSIYESLRVSADED